MTGLQTFTEKRTKEIKHMGSDCFWCSLEEGVSCMMYFCKKNRDEIGNRKVCLDGFLRKCPDYKRRTYR